ncbi:MAG TPA: hypothetical protein VF719_02660 [Abditibacteriaceae bacterium]
MLCYEANSAGDDTEFIDRIVCLSWPINIRMLAVFMPLYILYAAIAAGSGGSTETNLFDVLAMTFYSVYFYKWLHALLLRIAQKTPDQSAVGV